MVNLIQQFASCCRASGMRISTSEVLDSLHQMKLIALQIHELTPDIISETLNIICKYQTDLEKVRKNIDKILR